MRILQRCSDLRPAGHRGLGYLHQGSLDCCIVSPKQRELGKAFPMDFNLIVDSLQRAIPGLSAVYVFGSQATSGAGPESDLDLAILADGPLDAVRLWEVASALEGVAMCPVDLLDLRAASTVMQYQIITLGNKLWERDSGPALYESFILSEKTDLDEARKGLLDDIRMRGTVYGR